MHGALLLNFFLGAMRGRMELAGEAGLYCRFVAHPMQPVQNWHAEGMCSNSSSVPRG